MSFGSVGECRHAKGIVMLTAEGIDPHTDEPRSLVLGMGPSRSKALRQARSSLRQMLADIELQIANPKRTKA
jgi:2'-5' RNA ligase